MKEKKLIKIKKNRETESDSDGEKRFREIMQAKKIWWKEM